MLLEMTLPSIVKALTPIITPLIKESGNIIQDQRLKWNANNCERKLARILLNINTVKTMWSREKGTLINEFYYPSKLINKHSSLPTTEHSELLLSNTIIEGIVGQGKSILMRQLCNSAVELSLIPIFIELRMISEAHTLTSLIIDYMDAAGMNGGNHIFNYLADKNKIVLILDGFDEIPTKFIKNTVYQISHLQKVHDELKIIISSRPSQAVQNLAGFEIQTMAQLTEDDYELFLRKLVPDPTIRFNIQSAISGAPQNIKGVITTPLMLTLLVQVYHIETEIPETLSDFYEKLFNAVFIKHDGIKPGFDRERYSGLSESKLQKLFDAFCFMVLQSGVGRTLANKEFQDSFNRAVKYSPASSCEIEGFRKDIVNVACLMLNDGFEQTTFLHKSIMEYHAASFIHNSSDEFAEIFYRQAPEDHDTWAETLSFLSYIDEFRYGKMYALKEYPPSLQRLSEALKHKTNEALINYFNYELPGFMIHMNNSKPRAFVTDPVDRTHGFSSEILYIVINNIRPALKKSTNQTTQNAIRDTPKINNALGINTKSMVTHFDQSPNWESLGLLEQRLINAINKYETIVNAEIKKHEIFG